MNYKILIIFSILNLSYLSAQESQKPQKAPEPMDLPNFIIQGSMQLNINSGVKQAPEKSKPLTPSELDSLNSLEKQGSQPLPVENLITTTIERNFYESFVRGQIGRFVTGGIDAGIGAVIQDYDLYGQFGFETSDGHIANSNYNKLYARITSDYIAPAKYFIFGGSRTRTELKYSRNDYNLYSSPAALNRITNEFTFKVDVDGNYKGIKFETGAGFNGYQLNTDGFRNADNNFLGYLKVHNQWNNFLVAGNILLDMHTLRGQSANFIQADASLSLFTEKLSLTANAGLQLATNINGVDRGGLLLDGKLEYRINELFTLRGGVRSGLENKSFKNFAYQNPYISNMANFDFAYDIMNLNADLLFHPNENIGVSAGLRFRSTDRYAIFAPDLIYYSGSFDINYQTISLISSEFEAYWYITNEDKITSNLIVNNSSLSDYSSKKIPYIPALKLSLDYYNYQISSLTLKFGIDYVGERYADIENTLTLDSYINAKAEGSYKIINDLSVFLKLDNLLNSEIFVWQGYKERNIFVSIGAMWQF